MLQHSRKLYGHQSHSIQSAPLTQRGGYTKYSYFLFCAELFLKRYVAEKKKSKQVQKGRGSKRDVKVIVMLYVLSYIYRWHFCSLFHLKTLISDVSQTQAAIFHTKEGSALIWASPILTEV